MWWFGSLKKIRVRSHDERRSKEPDAFDDDDDDFVPMSDSKRRKFESELGNWVQKGVLVVK